MTRLLTAGLEHLWLRHGEVYTTSGEIAGCCIWMPPGAESNRDDGTVSFEEALTRLFQDSPRLSELFAIFEENHPTEPRYYLPFIAVDPSTQRRGVGKALVAEGFRNVGRDHAAHPYSWMRPPSTSRRRSVLARASRCTVLCLGTGAAKARPRCGRSSQ